MNYKMVLLSFFSLFTMVSCYTYNGAIKKAKSHFSNKFENESLKNIHSILNINGYYKEFYYRERSKENYGQEIVRDSSVSHMMFFEDGSFVMNILFDKNPTDNEISADMNHYLTKINRKGVDYWGGNWGIYRIENDTIVIQVFSTGALAVAYSLSEYKYKIIDKSTLKYISYQPLPLYAVEYRESQPAKIIPEKEYSLSRFMAADSLPPSDNRLKKEKWLWENEEDWKNYMDSLENRAKKKE